MINSNSKYKTIGQVAEVLNLIDKNGKKLTYILRFWEKEFKQIKPKYSQETEGITMIKLYKF